MCVDLFLRRRVVAAAALISRLDAVTPPRKANFSISRRKFMAVIVDDLSSRRERETSEVLRPARENLITVSGIYSHFSMRQESQSTFVKDIFS